jgi:hypothetical protein
MVFGVDKDGVIGTSCHTRLAADTDGLIEVDDTVVTLIHSSCRAGADARRIGALVAAIDLEVATYFRENPYFDRLYVCSRDAERNVIFGFTCGRASVTTDALGLVEYLDPRLR